MEVIEDDLRVRESFLDDPDVPRGRVDGHALQVGASILPDIVDTDATQAIEAVQAEAAFDHAMSNASDGAQLIPASFVTWVSLVI